MYSRSYSTFNHIIFGMQDKNKNKDSFSLSLTFSGFMPVYKNETLKKIVENPQKYGD